MPHHVPVVAIAAIAGVVAITAVAGEIVTHDADGRPVGVSRDMPVPCSVADVGVGVEESVLPRVADVGSILCHFVDVGVGVEDVKVVEDEVAEV